MDEVENALLGCFSTALRSALPADKLNDYVKGDRPAKNLLQGSDKSQFEAAGTKCVDQQKSKFGG